MEAMEVPSRSQPVKTGTSRRGRPATSRRKPRARPDGPRPPRPGRRGGNADSRPHGFIPAFIDANLLDPGAPALASTPARPFGSHAAGSVPAQEASHELQTVRAVDGHDDYTPYSTRNDALRAQAVRGIRQVRSADGTRVYDNVFLCTRCEAPVPANPCSFTPCKVCGHMFHRRMGGRPALRPPSYASASTKSGVTHKLLFEWPTAAEFANGIRTR